MNVRHKIPYQSRLSKYLSTLNITNIIVIGAFITVLIYGTCGTYYLRHQFSGVKSFSDAFYYTIVVFSTLGDNTISPLTDEAKWFTISMVVFGFAIVAMFASVIFYQILNHLNKIVHKIRGGRVHMKNHIILCGYSVITELLINKFQSKHIPFILLDNTQHPELNSGDSGNFIYVSVPSRPENLIKANIQVCKAVIASSDMDSENILVAMNANKLKIDSHTDYKIIIRVLYEEYIEVAQKSGATDVISPTLMAANAILELL